MVRIPQHPVAEFRQKPRIRPRPKNAALWPRCRYGTFLTKSSKNETKRGEKAASVG
jgi:hypothetical protein